MILQARFENYVFKQYLVVIPSFLSQIRFVFKTTCFFTSIIAQSFEYEREFSPIDSCAGRRLLGVTCFRLIVAD